MKRFLIFLNLFFIFTSFLFFQQDKEVVKPIQEQKTQTSPNSPNISAKQIPDSPKKEGNKISTADSLFLLQFFKQMGGKNWNIKWLTSQPIERWRGVVVKNYKIVEIRLPKNNLVGQLPEGIKQLKSLKVLDLSDNIIGGSLPEGLFDLTQLTYLDLSKKFQVDKKGRVIRPKIEPSPVENDSIENKTKKLPFAVLEKGLTGELSSKIGKLNKLEYLNLSGHALSGNFPLVLGCKKMKKLLLAGNQFSGTIPSEIYKMQSLIRLDLSYNGFSEAIPPSILTIKSLDHLNLSFNQLTGLIPGLKGIEISHLILEGNRFENTLVEAKRVVQKNLPAVPKKQETETEPEQEELVENTDSQEETTTTTTSSSQKEIENKNQLLPEKTDNRIFETQEIK